MFKNQNGKALEETLAGFNSDTVKRKLKVTSAKKTILCHKVVPDV